MVRLPQRLRGCHQIRGPRWSRRRPAGCAGGRVRRRGSFACAGEVGLECGEDFDLLDGVDAEFGFHFHAEAEHVGGVSRFSPTSIARGPRRRRIAEDTAGAGAGAADPLVAAAGIVAAEAKSRWSRRRPAGWRRRASSEAGTSGAPGKWGLECGRGFDLLDESMPSSDSISMPRPSMSAGGSRFLPTRSPGPRPRRMPRTRPGAGARCR